MALSKQDVQVPLGTGVETKADPKAVTGKLLVCENSSIDEKTGSSYLRFGHDSLPLDVTSRGYAGLTSLPPPPTMTGVQKVATLNNELVAITDKALFGYSESEGKWAWKGYIGNVTARTQSVMRGPQNAILSDSASYGGIMVVASIAYNTLTYGGSPTGNDELILTVLDEETKKVINEIVVSISSPIGPAVNIPHQLRCIEHQGKLYVYYNAFAGAGAILNVYVIDPANPSVIPLNSAVDGVVEAEQFDVTKVGNELVLLKATRGSAFNVKLAYIKPDGTIGGLADGLPANPVAVATAYGTGSGVGGISVSASATQIFCYFADNNNASSGVVQSRIYPLTLTAPLSNSFVNLASTQIVGIVSYVDAGDAYVYVSILDTTTFTAYLAFGLIGYLHTSGNVVTQRTAQITGSAYSKPIKVQGEAYIIVANTGNGTDQKSYFLLRENVSPGDALYTHILQPVCQMLVNEGIDDLYFHNYGTSLVESPTGEFLVTLQRAYAVQNSAVVAAERTSHLTALCALTFNDKNAYQVIEKENSLHISGGILFVYDGNIVFENGFLTYPKISETTQTGAGNVNLGAHTYQATYEWADRTGNKHISAPSLNAPLTITGSAQTVKLSASYCGYTYKQNTPYFLAVKDYGINFYRTPLNSTVKYKINQQSPEASQGEVYPGTSDYQDNISDADLIQREIIYTNGGVIENIATGSSSSIEDYQGRILLSDKEDGNTILFSKQKRPTLAYQFNPDLLFTVRESSSRVRSAKVLDDKVILFKDTSIFVQAGQGPSDTGENSDYLQNPQRIAANVGCPYPRSIVRFNGGIMFKSLNGFVMLTRSLEVNEKIGEPVSYYKNLEVRDVVLMEDRSEIRWVHSDGVCLIFNYNIGQWYTYTNHEATSCTVWNQKFVMAKEDGAIWVENKETFLDAGLAYSRRLVSPWFAMAGLQHAERIYRIMLLGEMRSPHNLKVYISYDYEPARREEFIFNSLGTLGDVTLANDAFYTVPPAYTDEDRTYDIQMRPAIQKCEAFRLEIYDEKLELEGEPIDGACAVFTSLTMTVGAKPSTLRPSSSRRAVPS